MTPVRAAQLAGVALLCGVTAGCGSGRDHVPAVTELPESDLNLPVVVVNGADRSHGDELAVSAGSTLSISGTVLSSGKPFDQRSMVPEPGIHPSRTGSAAATGRRYLISAGMILPEVPDQTPNPFVTLNASAARDALRLSFSGDITVPEDAGLYELRISASEYPESLTLTYDSSGRPEPIQFGPLQTLCALRLLVRE